MRGNKMSKYQKMTNEEIMKEFESVTATLYDYSNDVLNDLIFGIKRNINYKELPQK